MKKNDHEDLAFLDILKKRLIYEVQKSQLPAGAIMEGIAETTALLIFMSPQPKESYDIFTKHFAETVEKIMDKDKN